MKKLIISTIALLSVFFTQTTSVQAQESAGDYMTKISNALGKSKDEMFQYLKAVSSGKSARKVENRRKKLIEQIQEEKTEINSIGSYKGDATLKDAAKKELSIYNTVLKEDYGKIVNMEELAEQSYDNMELYLLAQEKADEKLHEASDSLQLVYKSFAAAHNINLIEGEEDAMDKKIKKMSETLHYYNQAYLIQLKCFHQERYILEAMGKGDVNAVQQNINAQKTLVTDAFEKVKAMEAYEGDTNLKTATKDLLTFFKDETEKDFTGMLDYFMKKDLFEKTKKNFDAKSKNERTKEVVEEYNKAVNDVNAAMNVYNNLNAKLNELRNKQNSTWYDKANDFVAKHSK